MNAQGSRVEEAAAPYRVAPLLTDHLDTFASAPEGFKRLRELVLNLAVRGRLVAQEANDEPAQHLIHKKKRRIDSEQHSPFTQLPLGWAFVSLSELGEFSGGKTPSTNNSAYWDGVIPWVTPKDMKFSEILDTQDHVSELALRDGLNQVEAGSVLIVVRSGILRRMLPVAIARTRCTVNQDLKALRLIHPQMAVFVRLLLLGHERWILENLTKTGTTVESVKFDELTECLFPLPPLAEQSRIVAKVDELMALIDALEAKVGAGETARVKLRDAFFDALADSPDAAATAVAWAQLAPHFDLLLQTPADVDRLQQTLLQLAVKGRLVPQDPNDEPASELLKRIRAEKDRLAADRKIKRGQPSAAVAENAKSFCVPHGWKWVRAIDLCASITDGDHLPPPKADEGIPFLVIGNIRDGKVAIESATRFVPKYYFDNLDWSRMPQVGDVLYTTVGSFGIPAPVTEVRDFCFQRHIALFRPALKGFQDFLTLFLRSDLAFKQAETGATGIAQKTVPLSALRSIAVPLPPLLEQSRIVAAVASLTALCDRLRERLAARRDLAAKLATALTETAARTVESSAC
jgi:type I restriction enzyme S subunit